MTLKWHSINNFTDTLYTMLFALEAKSNKDRLKSLELSDVDGHPTIGVGFDLYAGEDDVRYAVLKEMGLIWTDDQGQLTASQRIENGYISRLRALMIARTTNVTRYNDILQERHDDTNPDFAPAEPRRLEFKFNNENESKAAFSSLWSSVYRDRLSGIINIDDEKFANSKEQLVLASCVWGNSGLVGPRLREAIDTGNRAAAWYEIRYNSNDPDQTVRPGIAKRRFMESQIFGLYDNPKNVSMAEAENIFRTLQKNRDKILSYETEFGHAPDITTPTQNKIAAANKDYKDILYLAQNVSGEEVSELIEILIPAKNEFIESLKKLGCPDVDKWFKGSELIPTNIYFASDNTSQVINSSTYQKENFASGVADLMMGGSGDDSISSSAGNDVLMGESGNDRLSAGDGDDVLYGGMGSDTLYGGKGDDILYAKGGFPLGNLILDNKNTDALYGGTGQDILHGDDGDDYLNGGDLYSPFDGNADTLYGGAGFNTFVVDSSDTIRLTGEDDINGAVFLSDSSNKLVELKEATHYIEDPEDTYIDADENIYTFDSDTLVVNDGLRIVDFKKWAKVEIDPLGIEAWSALGILLLNYGGLSKLSGGDINANTLFGGRGDDILSGYEGDDTYLFTAGGGSDEIFEHNQFAVEPPYIEGEDDISRQARFERFLAERAGDDTLRFGIGLSPEQTILSREGFSLVITFMDRSDSVKIAMYFARDEHVVENLVFADGTVWHKSDVEAKVRNS
ncbi:calcium-binding protein [Kluyvera sichuanensis]|uniref:calcium-binding protein n=1 Tax=Kluyvera sichuanensis TaxID=2725494 RepID=UPI0034A37783